MQQKFKTCVQVSETEVIDMVNESDDDGSGALNFFEFLELMSRRFGEENPELTDTEVWSESSIVYICWMSM